MRGSPEPLTNDVGENCSKSASPIAFAEHTHFSSKHAAFQFLRTLQFLRGFSQVIDAE